jgi:solute carrier family 35 protein C2
MFSNKHLDFKFPLFTTSMHMLVQFSLASLVLYFVPSFRPRYSSISNHHNMHMTDAERSRHEEESKKPLMTKWFYCTRLGPCGMATGLDIGLGNMSLKFISLSFYTMLKSSSLAFVLLFAFLFRLESPSLRLILIISTMTAGVILMVWGEIEFSLAGTALVISASFFSGFRWGLTQILLLRNPATSNPFSSIFFLAPIMFLTLFALAIPVEGLALLLSRLRLLVQERGIFVAPGIFLVPGCIAFCMTASEFALLKRTSVVTLSIAGIFKEVVTIGAAGTVFGDRLSAVNVLGLVVTLGAIAGYNWYKIGKMREEVKGKINENGRYEGLDEESEGEIESGGEGQGGDREQEDWEEWERHGSNTREGDAKLQLAKAAIWTGDGSTHSEAPGRT